MRSTVIVRKVVDELGRIVIPMELRKSLGIAEKDALEIYVDGGQIILRKYVPGCVFWGEVNGVVNFKGKMICEKCRKDLGV